MNKYGNEMNSKTMLLQMAAADGDLRLKQMHFEHFGIQFHLNKSCCLDFDFCVSVLKTVTSTGGLKYLELIDITILLALDPFPYLETLVWCVSVWAGGRACKEFDLNRNFNLFQVAYKYFKYVTSLDTVGQRTVELALAELQMMDKYFLLAFEITMKMYKTLPTHSCANTENKNKARQRCACEEGRSRLGDQIAASSNSLLQAVCGKFRKV